MQISLHDVVNGKIYYRAEGPKSAPNHAQVYGKTLTHVGGAFTPNENLANVYEHAAPHRQLYELNLPPAIATEYKIGQITVKGIKGVVLDLPDWLTAHKRILNVW